ncbi:hypothetical protein Dsin_018465 [Dipteronia sinensis]|uniref:RNase H type-1 domain-containing protein n=1 Tax=Dipteronia sinensis TaxID=43782 RepID=A0AAE0E349_9ROSI|nr:hypothetical protein Dsin_018465 [Dipteronia sinensis]
MACLMAMRIGIWIGRAVGKALANRLRSVIGEEEEGMIDCFEIGHVQGLRQVRVGFPKESIVTAWFLGEVGQSNHGLCHYGKKILNVYCSALSPKVNFDKSGLSVSTFVSRVEQERLAAVIGVCHVRCHERYLGLPSFSEKDSQTILSIITRASYRDDSLCWHHTKDREYTVKSGYKFLRNELMHGGSSHLIEEVVHWSVAYLDECMAANTNDMITEGCRILRGISVVVESGLLPIVIESNALNVVNLVNSSINVCSDIGLVVRDIKDCIRNGMVDSIFFSPRKANVVAHRLAKHALLLAEDQFWMESYPPCVERVVQTDSDSYC